MIIFPVFAELEKKRDEINAHFHKDTEPQLIERVQQFGFVPVQPGDLKHMMLKEKSTSNEYLLTFRPYEIRVDSTSAALGLTSTTLPRRPLSIASRQVMIFVMLAGYSR